MKPGINAASTRFDRHPGSIRLDPAYRVHTGGMAEHDRWADRLLSALTPDAVFIDEPSSAH